MMLVHIGQTEVAARVHNAWLRTIEDGIHTADIYRAETSQRRVSTVEFADALIERLGQLPERLNPVHYDGKVDMSRALAIPVRKDPPAKVMVGVDIFANFRGTPTKSPSLFFRRRARNLNCKWLQTEGLKFGPADWRRLSAPTTGDVDLWVRTRRCGMRKSSGYSIGWWVAALISSRPKTYARSMASPDILSARDSRDGKFREAAVPSRNQIAQTNVALSVMGVAERAFETGQLALASSACSIKVASSIPGTSPSVTRSMLEIANPPSTGPK